MSTRPILAAEPRAVTGKKVATLRRSGILPAVVSEPGTDSEVIQIDAHDWEVLRRQRVGRNTLVDLKVASGRARPVLVQGIQEHPVSRRPLHVDFYVVRMTEEMAIDVPISSVGTSYAVDKLGGTLLHLRDTVHVRALPADLPSVLEVDISAIADFETTLHVSDLIVPPRVTLLTDPAELVSRVQPPRIELEVAPAIEAVEAAEAEAPAVEEASAGAGEEA